MIDIFSRRRSSRKFQNRPVSVEDKEALIEAALYAASSRGIRPWELVVVSDNELIGALSKVKKHGSSFLKNAPLAMVVLGIPEESDVWIEDTSILSTHLLIEAEYLGLGACWIQIRNRFDAEGTPSEQVVRTILEIPDSRSVESIIAIGYKDGESEPYTSEDLHTEKVFFQKYTR